MKLRACPFCKCKEPRQVKVVSLVGSIMHRVECPICGAKGPTFTDSETAVKLWNGEWCNANRRE